MIVPQLAATNIRIDYSKSIGSRKAQGNNFCGIILEIIEKERREKLRRSYTTI